MERPNTIPSLLSRLFQLRWGNLGKMGKMLVVAGLLSLGVAVGSFGTCLFGSCPLSSSPCSTTASASPCDSAAAADDDAPCPYAAQAAAQAAAPDDEEGEDGPPCHRD